MHRVWLWFLPHEVSGRKKLKACSLGYIVYIYKIYVYILKILKSNKHRGNIHFKYEICLILGSVMTP